MPDELIDDPLAFITALGSEGGASLPAPGSEITSTKEPEIDDSGGNPDAPEPPDEGQDLFADDQGAPYREYTLDEEYVCSKGLIQSPVASDDDTTECVFTKVHSAMWQLVVSWVVRRTGAPPLAPSSERDDDNLVLLEERYSKPAQVPMDNGKGLHWLLRGRYVYGLKKPINPQKDGLPGSTTPVTTEAANDALNTYDGDNFITDLLS